MATVQKITPHLWFADNCKEAMEYYTSVFPDSKIITTKYYPTEGVEGTPMEGMEGKVLTGVFELAGQRFMALDGGPLFKFNESVSFVIDCKDQDEVDYYWEKLSAVPEAEQCGWCKDKFGVSWQVIPSVFGEMMSSDDKEKVARVTQAFMPMKKLDVVKLQEVYEG